MRSSCSAGSSSTLYSSGSTPSGEIDALGRFVKDEMEHVHKLDVPLVADVHSDADWMDLK